MATIKEVKKIIGRTLSTKETRKQNILLVGDHGIGKSEILTDILKGYGYRLITLFVGQMADAGDFIGLPDRKKMKVEYTVPKMVHKMLPLTNENGQYLDDSGKITEDISKAARIEALDHANRVIFENATDNDGNIIYETKVDEFDITDFNPPKWWPFDEDEKVAIFLDEVNRGKPEINQCLMDLLLNKKLNGRSLPTDSIIIGAMNPMKDGYDVEELDDAFLDRWNMFEFRPTVEEWVDWAVSANVSRHVVGFIQKYSDKLDPPDERRPGRNYPSRRSWVKVSDIAKTMDLENGDDSEIKELMLIMSGIVGDDSASMFPKYLREMRTGLNAGKVISSWNKKIEKEIKGYSPLDLQYMNNQICLFLKEHEEEMKLSTDIAVKFSTNLGLYLDTVHKEIMAEFIDRLTNAYDKKEEWADVVSSNNKKIADNFIAVLNGTFNDESENDELYN